MTDSSVNLNEVINDRAASDKRFSASVDFNAAFEAMPGYIALLATDSPRYTILATTYDYLQPSGKTREAVTGRGLFEVFTPNPNDLDFTGEANLRSAFQQVITKKQSIQLPVQRYDITGSNGIFAEYYWRVVNKPVFDKQGEVLYILHTVCDITEQVKARQRDEHIREIEQAYSELMQDPVGIRKELEYKEQSLQLALEIGELGTYNIDLTRNSAMYSQKIMEWFGLSVQRMPFNEMLLRVHPDDRDHVNNAIMRSIEGEDKGRHDITYRIESADGRLRHLHSLGQVQLQGEIPVSISGIIQDVTAQVLSRKKLEENEHRYRNLIEESTVANALCVGREQRIQYANSIMLEYWGKDPSVIGKTLKDALPELEGQPFMELLDAVYTTGKAYHGKEQRADLTVNGKLQSFYFNFTYKVLRDTSGEIYGVHQIAIDVTDKVLAQQRIEEVVARRTNQLADLNAQLQQSNIELNEFAYIASHDLQEPLRKVRTYTGLMESALGDLPEKAKGYIRNIHYSTERMQTLIYDVLRFSQISSDKKQFQSVHLNSILENVISDYELLIEQKGAKITAGNLPVIEAIPLQMQQLFTNLISNSLKFGSDKRPPEISVTATQLPADELIQFEELSKNTLYYKLEFQDNGIGFNQEYAKQIFTIFKRLHSRSQFEGTGIGLALCRKIVLNHQGVIYARSVAEQGALFIIILPATHDNTGL